MLDGPDVEAVVAAAATSRTVKVAHRFGPDAVGDDAALHELAARLPASWWLTASGDAVPVTAASPAVLASELPGDSERSVVTRLYHVQLLPQLAPVIGAVYDELEAQWPASEPWLSRDAGLFLSSAGAVTSTHADRHHNLLLQLSGTKEIAVAAPGSRSHADIIARGAPSMRCAQMPADAMTYQLTPGTALYMPPYTVHWVKSTEQSVALSLGWSSAATVRAGKVHAANGILLRTLRLPARPVGARGEEAKLRLVAGASRLRSAVRRG